MAKNPALLSVAEYLDNDERNQSTLANREKQARFRQRREVREGWAKNQAQGTLDLLTRYYSTFPEKSRSGAVNQEKRRIEQAIRDLQQVIDTFVR